MTEKIIIFDENTIMFIKKEDGSIIHTPNIRKERVLQKDFKIYSLDWYFLPIDRFESYIECCSHIEVDSFQDSSKIVSDFPEYFL